MNIYLDHQEIVSEPSSNNIIKSYLEKNRGTTKSSLNTRISLRPKEILNESQVPIDTDPYLTRHRSHIIKSRISTDKSKTRQIKIARDVSSYLDSSILSSINKTHQHLSEDLQFFPSTKEKPVNFPLSTDLNTLKSNLSNRDLLIWSSFGLNSEKFHEFSEEFSLLGISKPFQMLNQAEHGGPSNRKEAQLLGNWLSFMLQKNLNSKVSSKAELIDAAQVIYTTCLKEILRQVSAHCVERAEVLQRVWKAYFTIMVKTIKIHQKSKLSMEKKLENELLMAKAEISKENAKFEAILLQKNEELLEKNLKISTQQDKIERMSLKVEELKHRMFILQMKYSKDRIRLLTLEDEYRNLREIQKIVLEEIDEDLPGIKKVQTKQKIRFRELSKIFMTDPLCGNLAEVKVPKVPRAEVRSLMELEKIDLENKIKMHEIQEKIEETAEELKEIALDTRDLAIPVDISCQTKLKHFRIPTVDVIFEQHLPQDLKLMEKLLEDRLRSENIEQKDLDMFFGQTLEDLRFESSDINLELNEAKFNEKILKEVSDEKKRSLKTVVKKITSTVVFHSQLTIKKLKERFEESVSQSNLTRNDSLKLRKQVFLTFKENMILKEEIAKLKEQNEKLTKSKKTRKVFKRATKTAKKKTMFKEFNFNQRVRLLKKDSISPAEAIFQSIMVKKDMKLKVKIRSVTLVKIINSLISDYSAQIKEDLIPQTQPLFIYIYDYFSTKHGGIKKVLESKYKQMLTACYYHKNIPSIKLFCRFLGLFEPLEIEFFRTYISILELLSKFSRIGIDIPTNETEDQLIPAIRCFEVISYYFKGKFSDSETLSIKNDMARITKPCPKCINSGVVEKIELVLFIIQYYRNFLKLSINKVKELFEAADLNNDKFLQFEEFDLLFRSIEPKKYSEDLSKNYFQSYSDLIAEVNGENFPAISYDKFSIFSLEKDVFAKKEQDLFVGPASSAEIQKKLSELQGKAKDVVKELKWRLVKSRKGTFNFMQMIEVLGKKLDDNEFTRSVYIAYLLINEESKRRLVDSVIEQELPFFTQTFHRAKIDFNAKKANIKELRKQITWKKSIESLSDWGDEKESKDEVS
jgi:hypothetical protein